MIVSCVKWGNKFSYKHVNRLYRMVQKNLTVPFTFVCHTEDATNIHPDIKIVPLDLSLDLEKWWWKLTLFQTPTDEVNIFFDLDVVIQQNINHFTNYVKCDKVCMVKAYWKSYELAEFDMNYNSSVMIWKGDCTYIWKEFIDNIDYYLLRYNGIDGYLYYHHSPNVLPRGEVYSRLFGIDENNCYIIGEERKPYFKIDYPVCIFNGWRRDKINNQYLLDDEGYDELSSYWN